MTSRRSSLPPTPAVAKPAGRGSAGSAWNVADPDRLQFFVPCVLKNDSQTSGIHWAGKARRARQQIDAVCAAVLSVLRSQGMALKAAPTVPKAVHFVAYHSPPAFDEPDGLTAACKHLRDGLIHAGIISNDAPRDGHVFTYNQVLTRKARGVLITVECRQKASV